MCDYRYLRLLLLVGIVDYVFFLLDNFSDLVDNLDYSDITFMVENVVFFVYKVILVIRFEYFR